MRGLTHILRAAAVFIAALLSCHLVAGSSVILRYSPKTIPEFSSVMTYAGKVELSSSSVKPSSSVTVVLLMDTLSPADLDAVKKDVLTLYATLHGAGLKVAILRSGSLGVAGPFSSRVQLKNALEEVQPNTDQSPAVSPMSILDTLLASVPQLGSNWSRVLLMGEIPPLESATVDYASGVLLRAFSHQQVRVSWFSPSGGNEVWIPLFQSTGGTTVRAAFSEFSVAFNDASQSFLQVNWNPAAPTSGFVVSRSSLLDIHGQVLLEAPDLAATPGAALPSIEQYSVLSTKAAEAAALLDQTPVTEDVLKRVRADLVEALGINPRDPSALLAAAVYSEKLLDYATAAVHRASLVEVRPQDGAAYAALGHALVMHSEFETAEAALKRASELGIRTPQIAEDFARVHVARKDDRGALTYFKEALGADAQRQEIWFQQARAAERLQNSSVAMHSFEEGLSLGGAHIPETVSLLRIYLATKQSAKASELSRRSIDGLPPDPKVRTEFASQLEEMQLTGEAVAAWKRVLEVQADSGQAHARISRLLLASGDAHAAEQEANLGLSVAPKLPELYNVKAEALEKQGRMYESRLTLEEGAAAVPEAALLSRLAAADDTYGGLAAQSYARLVAALGDSSKELMPALERGFAVAMRDGEIKQAQAFASLLVAANHPEFQNFLTLMESTQVSTMIPGGLDALAFAAHAKEHIPPGKFLDEYCRTLLDHIPLLENPASKKYVAELEEHFRRVAALEALGRSDGNRVVITISLNSSEARGNAERVLNLLGLRLRTAKGHLEIDQGEKKSQAKGQETASALALDQVGMEEALQAGKPFTFELPYEGAIVFPSEKLWRDAFYPNNNEPAGIASALLHNPKLIRLYIGISYLDRRVVSELLSAVDIRTLFEHYAGLLYLYSSAFAMQGGHAVVPGGRPAEFIWGSLVGVSPAQPGPFFHALLDRENGKVLAFFFALSQLDRRHQAFFTLSSARTSRFYKLFAESEEGRGNLTRTTNDSAFTEFLRSVPLDETGHVDFPGSAEVWAVARGSSSRGSDVTRMMKKVSKAVAPDIEDELLLHLAQTRYKEKTYRFTELENFLAVARIDAHRVTPLDDQSALLLAQHYSDFSYVYPYFTDLAALEYSDFNQFFRVIEGIRSHPLLDENLQLGQFHSLIEWVCLLRRRRFVNDTEAAKLFRYVCDRFAAAAAPSDYTAASLESALSILGYCKPGVDATSADERIVTCMVGASSQPAGRRAMEFRRVLDLQKVPSLDALLAIYKSAGKSPANGAGDFVAAGKSIDGFVSVPLTKGSGVTGKEKESILRYDPAPLRKISSELAQAAGRNRSNSQEIAKLSQTLLAELQPQVTLALAGPVYAFFLRPSDLLVSEDPLLLRKHHYFRFDSEIEHKLLLPEAEFTQDSQGAGSYFIGGFGQFAVAAGTAAAVGAKAGGAGGDVAVAAQIAAIRSATWEQLNESDQRLASLRITVAREWILESARNPALLSALGEETMGLLSANRRANLLNSLDSGNWYKVWSSVTLPDLFMLGGNYLDRFKTDLWTSPVTVALRSVAATNDGVRLNTLGAIHYESSGCAHPHLLEDAPYEEYEKFKFPTKIAERSAEFKLFLVFQADKLGVPPAALADVAEPLVLKAFRSAHMSDSTDWRALLIAFGGIMPNDLQQALQQ